MKKLIFVRHGRAEDQEDGISDFERSLTVKGKVIARQMALRFREKEKEPGLMITSPAFRALETAFIFASEYGIKPEDVRVDSNLYFKVNLKTLVDLLKKTGDEVNMVTMFGHNPAFTEIPDRLSSDGCEFLTKTSIACITFNISSWSEIKSGTGRLEYFLKPEKQS